MSGRRDRALWFLGPLWRQREEAEQEHLRQEAEEARTRPSRVWRIGRRAGELNAKKAAES